MDIIEIIDERDLDNKVTLLKNLEIDLEKLENKKKQRIQKTKEKFDQEIKEVKRQRDVMEASILVYIDNHEEELLKDGDRSKDMTSGRVGRRKKRAHVELTDGQTIENLVKELKEKGLTKLLRVKFEADKTALVKYGSDEDMIPVLKELRVEIVTGEESFVDVKR